MSANNYFVQPKAALGGNQEPPRTERGQGPLAVRVKSVLSEAGVKIKGAKD